VSSDCFGAETVGVEDGTTNVSSAFSRFVTAGVIHFVIQDTVGVGRRERPLEPQEARRAGLQDRDASV
jgi:hypothetical protein